MMFGATSTAEDVLQWMDLSGSRVLVTGVSAGVGAETARVLVAHGAHVVGAARDPGKSGAAPTHLAARAPSSELFQFIELDLASLVSVRACAEALLKAGEKFDVVIANAGVMAVPLGTTVDGFETHQLPRPLRLGKPYR